MGKWYLFNVYTFCKSLCVINVGSSYGLHGAPYIFYPTNHNWSYMINCGWLGMIELYSTELMSRSLFLPDFFIILLFWLLATLTMKGNFNSYKIFMYIINYFVFFKVRRCCILFFSEYRKDNCHFNNKHCTKHIHMMLHWIPIIFSR